MQNAEKILLPTAPGEIRIRLNRIKPTVINSATATGSSNHQPH